MLLGNYSVIHKSPGKFLGGVGAICDNNWGKNGQRMALYTNEYIPDQWGLPVGYGATGWFIPRKAGYVGGYTDVQFYSTVQGIMGLNGEGSMLAQLSGTASLQLIVSGEGTCQINITATGSILGNIYGQGTSTITLSGDGILGAAAFMSGTSSVTLSATASMSAIGHMEGYMTPFTELSPQGLADAVWRSLKSQYVSSDGTMGKEVIDALIAASSGGSPLTTEEHNQLMKALTTSKFIALKD